MKAKHGGRVYIAIGCLLLLSALGLTGYNQLESARAGESAQETVAEIVSQLETANEMPEDGNDREAPQDLTKMRKIDVSGLECLGILSVPDRGIELPVLAECNMVLLKRAPCCYYGSYLDDNMVIAGHNYASHFSPIKRIGINEEVDFTTVEGTVYRYTVDNIEILQPEQVREMVTGDWDLTLFTCTTGGQSRCAVRCSRIR